LRIACRSPGENGGNRSLPGSVFPVSTLEPPEKVAGAALQQYEQGHHEEGEQEEGAVALVATAIGEGKRGGHRRWMDGVKPDHEGG
jgi:hypothetical protein